MVRNILIIGLLCSALAACHSAPGVSSSQPSSSYPDPAGPPTGGNHPAAFVSSQPLTWADLQQPLLEAAGGQILLEEVLDRALKRRLADRSLKIGDADLQREKKFLMETLDRDADQAQRLLDELRKRRGLGEGRFARLLFRNAALRLLVQDQVQVSDAAVRQAYENQYGPRFEARLIAVDNLPTAAEIIRRTKAGESFIDLAIHMSTDSSRAQGGLLPPISPADPTYPTAVRAALARLEPGQLSDAVALERGFAVLKLERKIEGPGVKFDDVKEALSRGVRLDVEQMLMQRLARTIVAETDVVVLEPALQKGWEQQKKRLSQENP